MEKHPGSRRGWETRPPCMIDEVDVCIISFNMKERVHSSGS